jgi:protein-disulfide isomerase
MASRTRQKEEARARRLAEEQAREERARRTRRMRMIGGMVLIAVAVVAVAIAVSLGGGGNSSSGLKTGTQASKTSTQVSQLLNGIPQSGATLGNPNAPVTMTYYGDLECPICQQFTIGGGFPQLVSNDVRQGKVKVVYRAFQTATRDPQVFQTQQAAALAAGKQNRFWDYTELFYHEQGQEDTGYVTDSYLTGLAKQIPGLNLSAWQSARSDQSLVSQVQSDEASGSAAGVQGTPTLILQGPKGKTTTSSSVPSYSDLQQAITQVS